MALDTIGTPQIRRVTSMEDPIADWVSLVDQGANWSAFESVIQKRNAARETEPTDKRGGEEMPGAWVQSILLPGSQELEDLAANPQYSWLRDLVTTVKRTNAHSRYVFTEHRKFNTDSLKGVALGDTGAFVTVGELAAEAKDTQPTELVKAPADLVAAMQESQDQIIARLIGDETWRFEDILFASLRQESAEPKKRKQIIMNALSAYWDFLNNILDVTPATQVKIARPAGRTDTGLADNDNHSETTKNNQRTDTAGEGEEMKPEEITALVAKTFDEKAEELIKKLEDKSATKPEDAGAADANKPASLAEVVKGVTDIAGVVTGLTETIKAVQVDISEMKKAAKPEAAEAEVVEKKEDKPAAAEPPDLGEVVKGLKESVDTLMHSVLGTPPEVDPRREAKKADPGSWDGLF